MSRTLTPALFPIHDYPPGEVYPAGMNPLDRMKFRSNLRAQRNGEFRPPRAGEWYISGAIPEAYYAHRDLTTPYHIARLVRIQTRTTHHVVEVFE